MAILLRKGAATPRAILPNARPLIAKKPEPPSPFRESFHDAKALEAFNKADRQKLNGHAPKEAVKEQPKPIAHPSVIKKIVKLSGGHPIPRAVYASPKPSSGSDARAAGLAPLTDAHAASRAKWPDVRVGDQVKITNSLFPWVQHYAPGDICEVTSVVTWLTVIPEDPVKYRHHMLRIISDGPRKGKEIMLFRWEFAPVDKTAPPPSPGRVNHME